MPERKGTHRRILVANAGTVSPPRRRGTINRDPRDAALLRSPVIRNSSRLSRRVNSLATFFKVWATPLTILVAVAGLLWSVYQFNAQQSADVRMQAAQEAASAEQTLDQQHQTALSGYLDNMSNLLLVNGLQTAKPGSVVLALAEARTETALQNLDGTRKGTLILFLWKANLINRPHPIITLDNVDMTNINLSGADLSRTTLSSYYTNPSSASFILSGADLSGGNLSGADLSSADLIGVDLSSTDQYTTDLSDANLIGAHLNYANLSSDSSLNGTDLSGADLRGADLGHAALNNADLSDANLSSTIYQYHTDLSYAHLSGANLEDANLGSTPGTIFTTNLKFADLSAADLSGANLSYADLSGADLSGADMSLGDTDLSYADLSGADLSGVKDLNSANLSGAFYNTKTVQLGTSSLKPTQWPQGFDPKAAGAFCEDC